tara:strand:- start:42 stop:560 length:519 start_codon:yes stop_codon:yes gene_type:complete
MKKMTKPQLIVELKKQGIGGYSRLKRDEMEELLNAEARNPSRILAAALAKPTAPAPAKPTATVRSRVLAYEKHAASLTAPAPAKPTAAARLPYKSTAVSRLLDIEFIMGNMAIDDKGMVRQRNGRGPEVSTWDYVCDESKNTNLALGQQTVECGEKKPKPRRGKYAGIERRT